MENDKIVVIEDKYYGGYETVQNPVSDYWDIQLYLSKDSSENYSFVVKFTSILPLELPDGKILTQTIYINEENFEDKERSIRKSLRKIGVINDIVFRGIKEYVQYLKMNKEYSYLEKGSIQLETSSDRDDVLELSGEECYQTLLHYIDNNVDLFPNTKEAFILDKSQGLILSTFKKEECKVLVIEGEKLQNIIGVVEKAAFESVIREFKERLLLLSGDSKGRMTSKYTLKTKHRINAYIIRIE